MSKSGILLVAIIVILLIAFSSATYAFYSSSRDEFTFEVGSAYGQSVALTISSSSTGLRPATTTAGIKTYGESSTDVKYQMAKYFIQYTNSASDAVNVKFYVTGVEYTPRNGVTFTSTDEAYLDVILDYGLTTETTNNVSYANHTSAVQWLKEDDLSNQLAVNSGTTGYLYCYVRFNVTQELVPPDFDDMTIQFNISSTIIE